MQRNINFVDSNPSQPDGPEDSRVVIALEGIDAAGKATQAAALAQLFSAQLRAYPNYKTETGQAILKFLKGDVEVLDPACYAPGAGPLPEHVVALQALMTINRYEAQGEIRSLITGGHSLVLDRYYMSGVVYGQCDGLSENWLYRIHQDLIKPDLYVYIDISVEESFRRRPDRLDKYEENREKLGQARMFYNKAWKRPNVTVSWRMQPTRWLVIDGTLPPDVITKQIAEAALQIVR